MKDISIEKNECKNLKKTSVAKNGITTKLTDNFFEEKKFALFNVILKDERCITNQRTSIGYMLPNNQVYDFISKETFNVYELNKPKNYYKEGQYALIINVPFEKSNRKIHITKHNLLELKKMFQKYIDEYNQAQESLKKYAEYFDNDEYIPQYKKELIIY